MKIMLLGTPGSGKGTLAQSLSIKIGIPHISTGDIFRIAIRNETQLGLEVKAILANGGLVPDELTCNIVFERLANLETQGFILDGFPRTIPQAQAFDQKIALDAVVLLELDEASNIKRLTERMICPGCGEVYHLEFRPPKVKGACDKCDAIPAQRPDDHIDVVYKRLAEYHSQTEPLIEHYHAKQKITRFNALQNPEVLLCEVQSFLQKR